MLMRSHLIAFIPWLQFFQRSIHVNLFYSVNYGLEMWQNIRAMSFFYIKYTFNLLEDKDVSFEFVCSCNCHIEKK